MARTTSIVNKVSYVKVRCKKTTIEKQALVVGTKKQAGQQGSWACLLWFVSATSACSSKCFFFIN
jgi:hypothetical protein